MSRTINPAEISNEALSAGEQKHNNEWRDGELSTDGEVNAIALAAT